MEHRNDGKNVNGWHWQEVNKLEWTKQRLAELLPGAEAGGGSNGWSARVTSVKSVTGEVSRHASRVRHVGLSGGAEGQADASRRVDKGLASRCCAAHLEAEALLQARAATPGVVQPAPSTGSRGGIARVPMPGLLLPHNREQRVMVLPSTLPPPAAGCLHPAFPAAGCPPPFLPRRRC